ncbi:MAG: magnesium transporter [Holosporales bacterium]|nr:magnesium transporter [Holosporales bacterium]
MKKNRYINKETFRAVYRALKNKSRLRSTKIAGQKAKDLKCLFVQKVRSLLGSGSTVELRNQLANLHSADIADLYEDLSRAYRKKLLHAVPDMIDANVLLHLEKPYKSDVIELLGADHFMPSLRSLAHEDLFELIKSLEPQHQMCFMVIHNARKDALELWDKYVEDSVGRSMSLDFLLIPQSWTVENAISYIKSLNELSASCVEVFTVNDSLNPVGVIPLATLITADKQELVKDIANYDIITVNANLDKEKAYVLFSKYHSLVLPVVENSGKMVGVLRADDILKIAEEEATEDYMKLGGLSEWKVNSPLWYTCFTRLRWLSVSILNALFSPCIIYLFQDSIQQVISLATLMPIVGSIGGNVGVQTVSVVIKAFSSEQLREQRFFKIILKEAAVGSINGLAIGIFLGTMAGFWFKSATLGAVLAAATFSCSTWAAVSGALLPIVFDKLGFDASLSSGPLVTTITDVSGFVIFLGLATLFMM